MSTTISFYTLPSPSLLTKKGASAIALVSAITLIFAARYIDITRYALKLSWMALGVTVSAEVIGKFLLNKGFATQLRPRRYYTVSRETIDGLVGDAHELINFVVIETQRILFVENVPASIAVSLPLIGIKGVRKLTV